MASGSQASSRGTFDCAHPQAAPLQARTDVSHFLQVAAHLPGERCNGRVKAPLGDPLKEKKKRNTRRLLLQGPCLVIGSKRQIPFPLNCTHCLIEPSSSKAEVTLGKCKWVRNSHVVSFALNAVFCLLTWVDLQDKYEESGLSPEHVYFLFPRPLALPKDSTI